MLYKYYSDKSDYALANFRDNHISFTSIQILNDPFEGVGEYIYSVSDEAAQYWENIGTNVPELLSQRFSDEIQEVANFCYRIFCCTKRYDNLLMWTHYANERSGFCVGYCKEDVLKISDWLMEVQYSDDKAPINDYNNEMILNLLTMKSKCWSYEEEWRALYKLRSADVESHEAAEFFNPRENNSRIYKLVGHAQTNNLKTLSSSYYIIKECIPRELYLGEKMSAEKKRILMEIAEEKGIKIYQMCSKNNLRRLKFHPINR